MVVTTYVVILPTVSGAPESGIDDQPARVLFFPTISGAQTLADETPGATYHSWDLSDPL